MREESLSNLIIAGVTKAGTTALFGYLAQHPAICPARHKETHYFAPLRYGPAPLGPREDFAAHFAHCGDQPYRLESAPGYVTGGPRILEAVREVVPDARIIVSLRDPVDRLWSSYKMKRDKDRIPPDEDFERFVGRSLAFHDEAIPIRPQDEPYRSASNGFYAEHLPAWMDAFGDRLRIVFFEEWIQDPAPTVAGVCNWLEIDATAVDGFDFSVRNRSARQRSAILRRVAYRLNRLGNRHLRSRPGLHRLLRRAYEAVNARDFEERPGEDVLARLREVYAPSNRALAQMLSARGHEALPDWLSHDPVAGRDPEHTDGPVGPASDAASVRGGDARRPA